MKIKQHLHISRPDNFMKGDYTYCFSLFGFEVENDSDYIHCGEIEVDVDVDTKRCVESLTASIDLELGKHTAAITILEQRKAELLALPAPKDEL